MSAVVEWVNGPPPRKRSGRTSQWVTPLQECAKVPNKWRVFRGMKAGNSSAIKSVAEGLNLVVEVTQRAAEGNTVDIYIRVVQKPVKVPAKKKAPPAKPAVK